MTSDASDDEIDMGPSSPVQATPDSHPFVDPSTTHERGRLQIDTYVNPTEAVVSPNGQHRANSPTKSHKARKSIQSPRSVRSAIRHAAYDGAPVSGLKGVDRFRSVVRKVMAMRRTSTYLGAFRGAGAEPGIDPRRPSAIAAYGHIREACSIQVVDYSGVRSKFESFDNGSFLQFLESNGGEKPEWAKVRWIAVGGISWDVISALALTYGTLSDTSSIQMALIAAHLL